MRKILLSAVSAALAATIVIPAFAQGSSVSSSMMAKSKSHMTVDTSCMITAVDKRDTAIINALATVSTALQTRRDALKAAWAITDAKQRKTAINAAWAAFKGTWKTFNQTRKAAWTRFKTDAKACHISTSDATNESMQGSGSL